MLNSQSTPLHQPAAKKKRNYSMFSIVAGLLMYGLLLNYKLAMDKYSHAKPISIQDPPAAGREYVHPRRR